MMYMLNRGEGGLKDSLVGDVLALQAQGRTQTKLGVVYDLVISVLERWKQAAWDSSVSQPSLLGEL